MRTCICTHTHIYAHTLCNHLALLNHQHARVCAHAQANHLALLCAERTHAHTCIHTRICSSLFCYSQPRSSAHARTCTRTRTSCSLLNSRAHTCTYMLRSFAAHVHTHACTRIYIRCSFAANNHALLLLAYARMYTHVYAALFRCSAHVLSLLAYTHAHAHARIYALLFHC